MTHSNSTSSSESASIEAGRPLLGPSPSDLARVRTFNLIQRIRYEVDKSCESSLTWEQLHQPSVDFSVVRPLVAFLSKVKHPAMLFALLCNRVNYLEDADDNLAYQSINITRANLCELLAIKLLPIYNGPGLELATVLTSSFHPFTGATSTCFDPDDAPSQNELHEMSTHHGHSVGSSTTLELALLSEAKRLIKSALVQQVIDALYTGAIIYQPHANRSIIQDNYKVRAVQAYVVQNRPFLDHYVLRVPKIRAYIEFGQFVIMVLLFLSLQATRDINRMGPVEIAFAIFEFGFALDEFASSRERGFKAYLSEFWNVFDCTFLLTYFAYISLRIYGLVRHRPDASVLAFDILACGAVLLFPRLTGSLISDNIVVLGLRAMVKEFCFFMVFASICASGFLVTLWVLARGNWELGRIAWLMLNIWFGNSFAGFAQATSFHPVLGPIVIVMYSAFSNTLLLTILISILSNTFSNIQASAVDEFLFYKAARTLERYHGDALFEYCVPLNILALSILFPLSFLLDSRQLHKTNVLLIRLTNFPILLFITLLYRLKALQSSSVRLLGSSDDFQNMKSLGKGFNWTSPSESIEEAFRRKVSAEARKVPGLDTEEGEAQVRRPSAGGASAFLVRQDSSATVKPRRTEEPKSFTNNISPPGSSPQTSTSATFRGQLFSKVLSAFPTGTAEAATSALLGQPESETTVKRLEAMENRQEEILKAQERIEEGMVRMTQMLEDILMGGIAKKENI